MKILRFLPLAAIALAAVSCQNSGSNGLSGTASQTDSLMYYLGQMNAADYLREANRDTTMKEASQKQAYLNGVRAGLAALKDGNDAYNKGIMMGMQMASQMMSFCEQMDVNINKSSYINSLSGAIMADTMPNTGIAQTEFRKVMQNIENAKAEKDKKASQESLAKAVENAGLPKISDDLYGKVVNTSDGEALANGQDINLTCEITKADGSVVNIPFPANGTIGQKRNFPELVSEAILTLKSGETGEFMTTAHALLGSRAKQFDLDPNEVLTLKLTPTLQAPAEEEAK